MNKYTKQYSISTCLIILILSVIVPLHTYAKARYPKEFYNSLLTLPLNEIVKKGLASQSPDTTMAYYTVAIARYEAEPEKYTKRDAVFIYTNAGYTSLYPFRNFDDAYYYLRQAEEAAKSLGDSAVMSIITLNLANVFTGSEDLTTATNYFLRSMRLARENNMWEAYLIGFIGYIYPEFITEGDISTIKEQLDIFSSIDLPDTPMRAYAIAFHKGIKLMLEGKYEEAAETFEESVSLIDTRHTPERYLGASIILKAKAYDLLGMPQKAITYLTSKLADCPEEIQISIYEPLSQYYSKIGDNESANKYKLLFLEGEKKLNIPGRSADVISAQNTMDRTLLQKDVDIMQQENKRRKLIAWICAAWALLATALLFLWITNKKLNISKRNLFFKNQALAKSATSEAIINNTIDTQTTDESLKTVWEKVSIIMLDNPERFSTEFSALRLASLADEHPNKVSKAIKLFTGGNFNTWLTEIRIKEACLRLSDLEQYGKYTISAIAEDLGFKARTHFAKVFKQHTGLSPSEYQKQARESHRMESKM